MEKIRDLLDGKFVVDLLLDHMLTHKDNVLSLCLLFSDKS